jgi:hypothetical protein
MTSIMTWQQEATTCASRRHVYKSDPTASLCEEGWRRTSAGSCGTLHLDDRLADGILLLLLLPRPRPQPAEAVLHMLVRLLLHLANLGYVLLTMMGEFRMDSFHPVPHLTPVYRIVGMPCWSMAQHPDQQPFSSGPPGRMCATSSDHVLRIWAQHLNDDLMWGQHHRESRQTTRVSTPGVGRRAIGSCSQLIRSALDACPQHMRHAQSLLSGMC